MGGLLVRGPSGTAKSTAVRGLAVVLPEIEVVADCPFGCDPERPCVACRMRVAAGERLPAVRRQRRLVNLPLNATEDRVAGTVDIARALREGVKALEPGLLAEANRGILYVDEINLLDDHLVDVLLDAAALGVNVVEREGVSVSHPARFLLIGTMNPEFALERPRDPLERAAAGRRVRSLVSLHRGKYSRPRLARRDSTDLALDATLRAAAARAGSRRLGRIAVEAEDLRRKVRSHRSPFAVVLVVDNSYSVHAERMVERVKGLALRLLEDAARRGDRVALVAFKGGVPEGTVALPLTRSLSLARRRLEAVPLSGRTPLADALARARRLLRQELLKHPNAVPLVVCLTGGLPTVPRSPGGDPVGDAVAEARELRRGRIACVVADASPPARRAQSIAPALAAAAGGLYLPFEELVPDTFAKLLAQLEAR